MSAGDDLATLIADAAAAPGGPGLRDGDVVVVAQKVVSKAEGRIRSLADAPPGDRARELAAEHDKDPRLVQVVLDEWRGRPDAYGRMLRVTEVALADQFAAAADLARAKDSQEPVVVIRGVAHVVTTDDGPGAAALRRPAELDLFR